MRVECTNLTKLVRGEPNANNELVPKSFFGTADIFRGWWNLKLRFCFLKRKENGHRRLQP